MKVWVVIAEYTAFEDKESCGSPDVSPYVVGVFEDLGDAERAADKERTGGDLGDFHGTHEWSDCGWWVGVYESDVTLASAPKGGSAWGIPRRRNDASGVHVGVIHRDTYGGPGQYEDKYTLVAEDANSVVGHMAVTVFRDVAHVDWIEVDPGRRRQGVATALYRKLYAWAASEGVTVKHGMTTDEGAATLEALAPELAQLKQRLMNDTSRV